MSSDRPDKVLTEEHAMLGATEVRSGDSFRNETLLTVVFFALFKCYCSDFALSNLRRFDRLFVRASTKIASEEKEQKQMRHACKLLADGVGKIIWI